MRVLAIALGAVLLAGCSSEPERPNLADVPWNEYAPLVKERVTAAVRADDCSAMQVEFNAADDGNAAHAAKYGSNNADLMGYILDSMEFAGCP